MFLKKLPWVIICASPALLAEEALHLNEIEVTADPLSNNSQHIVQPTSVITREALDRKNKTTVSDLIENTPGIHSSGFGPSVGRPVIRGQSGARVAILSDGLSSMDISTISPDHAVAIGSVFVDQVEILRGPATLLYGSNASGGLVNVVSNKILDYVPENLEGQLYTHYDSAAEDNTGGFQFNAGYGEMAFHIDSVWQKTGDLNIPGFGSTTPDAEDVSGTLDNSDLDSHDMTLSTSWVTNRGFVGLSVNVLDKKYGIPSAAHSHEEEHEEEEHEEEEHEEHHEEEGVRVVQEQVRLDLKAELDDPLPGFTKLKTRWGYNNHEHQELEEGSVATQLDNKEWQGRVELLHSLFDNFNGAVGMEFQSRDLTTSGEEAFLADSSLKRFGIFVLERVENQNWHAEMSGRYESHQTRSDSATGKISHDLFSFSTGAGYHFTPTLNGRLSFSHSQRAPAIEELYADGAHLATNTFERGNTDLKKERSNTLDLIFSKQGKRLTSELSLFASWVDDYIYAAEGDRNNDGILDRVEPDFSGDLAEIVLEDADPLLVDYRQQDARFYGFEFQSRLSLFEQTQHSLDMTLWADYVRAKFSNDQNLPRISPWRVGLGLDYHRGALAAYADVAHTGKQSHLAQLETQADSYTNLVVGISYDLAAQQLLGAKVFLRANNLLDEEIRQQASFIKDVAPLAGRSIMAGVRVEF